MWVEKTSFDISTVLPLKRWKKEKIPEREEFSDEELSHEEDSTYEEIVIPKKRKRKTEKATKKRVKQILKMPKKQDP